MKQTGKMPKVNFFMIVTDPDILIADYAVKSYRKLLGLDFVLTVYSNWVSPHLKARYFPEWSKLSFVTIIDPPRHSEEPRPRGRELQGPYERSYAVWERELPRLHGTYLATVDADFEIFEPEFVFHMLDELDDSPSLVAFSTDYQPLDPQFYDSYHNEQVALQERWQTWFCIYRAVALQHLGSLRQVRERGVDETKVWDDFGPFQHRLVGQGYQFRSLDWTYQTSFLHYGAFSKNRDITEKNVCLYRAVCVLSHRGLWGAKTFADRVVRYVFREFVKKCLYRHVDRSQYWNREAVS